MNTHGRKYLSPDGISDFLSNLILAFPENLPSLSSFSRSWIALVFIVFLVSNGRKSTWVCISRVSQNVIGWEKLRIGTNQLPLRLQVSVLNTVYVCGLSVGSSVVPSIYSSVEGCPAEFNFIPTIHP